MKTTEQALQKRIRINIGIVIFGLAISGITAFPLQSELALLVNHFGIFPGSMQAWLTTIHTAISNTNRQYPYLSYGTDWLAFAHIMLAVLFIGPYQQPVRNIWVIKFGIIACVAILPLAFIAGNIRHIPFFWQLIDCSFGAIGIIPLYIAYKAVTKLEVVNGKQYDIKTVTQ